MQPDSSRTSSNRLSLPSLISQKLTHPSVHRNDENSPTSISSTVKNDLGAWWNGKRATDTRPILPQLQSNSSYDFSNSTHSTRPRANSAAGSSNRPQLSAPFSNFVPRTNDDFAALETPNNRRHLTYRDDAYSNNQYPQSPYFEQSRYPDAESTRVNYGKEEESMRAAIEASRVEVANSASTREEIELQKALAESSALARSRPPRADSTADDPDFQRAIAESRALIEVAPTSLLSSTNTRPSSSHQMIFSNPLEASERKMQARNEKSRFFAEAGEHGWKPPGARAANEEEEEARMLELAIRISLEEEAIRKRQEEMVDNSSLSNVRIPPPLPRRPVEYFSSTKSLLTTTSPTIPPKRPLPVLPIQDANSNASSSDGSYSTSPPSSPNPASNTMNSSSKPTLAFIAPSRPRIFSFSTNDGSPEERPYLTSESFTTAKENQSDSSQVDDLISRSGSHGTFGTKDIESSNGGYHSAESSSNFESGRQSFESASSDASNILTNSEIPSSSNIESDSITVRNPSTAPVETDLEGKFSPFSRNSLTGRSMSLISERTEPSNRSTTSVSSHDQFATTTLTEIDDDFNSPSKGSFRIGGDTEKLNVGASPTLLARIEKEKQNGVYNDSRWSTDTSRNHEVDQIIPASEKVETLESLQDPISPLLTSPGRFQEHLHASLPPVVTDESPRIDPEEERHQPVVFGDGIRFGLTAACADEPDHSCIEDGLASQGPFPDKVLLSTCREGGFESSRKFAIESYTWTSLLRLLMWYGDTIIDASADDTQNSEHRHCESALSLAFRRNDEGVPVIRLTITLLSSDQYHTFHELSIVPSSPTSSPINSKGKAKARLASTIFELPDHQILPTRLNSIAISLYTLRHLSNIAASTQASKDASLSYLNLRTLATSISELAKEHDLSSNEGVETKGKEEDRLVTRLKDRLRRLGGGGGKSSSAKLSKAPPSADRTRAVEREERVLADEEGSGVLVENEREVRYDSDNNTTSDMRYLPRLSKNQ